MAGQNQGVPRCTCFLFIAAITCHSLVLFGNISTALMLKDLGSSAGGWGSVAFSVTHALDTELNPAMAQVTKWLTATIQATTALQQGMDTALSVTGSTVDSTLQNYDGKTDPTYFKAKALPAIEVVAGKSMEKVKPLVHDVLNELRPALSQVGEWLGSFSAKIQDTLEEFGTVADRAQKLFDQVMQQMASTGGMYKEMVFDTYHIFDPYDDGIDVKELQQAANQYGITSLQGQKAVTLMKKYNTDNKGGIDIHEYEGLVTDPSLPGLMTTILRTYSNRLASVGSELKVVKLRAEVASAIVDYLTLVASKNLTKVGWVTGRLVSGELPLEFTADVFYELYKAKTDSNNMSPIDVGSLIINYTLHENPAQVIAAVDLIADPAFFAGEGFDITIADETVSQVVSWIEMSDWGKAALLKLAKVKPSNGQTFAEAYDEEVKAREVKYSTANGLGSPEANSYHTQAAQTLRNVLLGGPAASSGSNDPEAAQASGSAQPAKPQTLKFAAELSVNVSQSVKDFNEQCYQYSGSSSNPLDSTCNSINGMIKKTQSFLTLMNNYAGPGGPEFIEKQADDFINGSLQDMVLLSGELIDEGIASVQCSAGNAAACKLIRDTDYTMHLSGATTFLTDTMKDLQSSLPQVIKALTTAKKEVSTISGVINSISQMLGLKAPPLMDQMGMIYKIVWIAYFVFFFLFSATMLFYGFWANGWFGGPQADLPESEYQPPQTFVERIRTCCGSCLACCRSCTSGHLCFWSMLLLAQVIVLLMFIISLVICLITGIQAFFGAGCSKIYLIGDAEVCSAVLGIFKVFLKTFGFEEPIEDTCFQKNLLTCKIIRDSVFHTAIFVIIGALLASVFSFQMLLDSAIKHERARCARIWEEEGLDKKSG